MPAPLCRQIKAGGHRCRAVALLQRPFCYFHERQQKRHRDYRSMTHTFGGIELLALEDSDSVGLAISQVVNAIAANRLDMTRAGLLLRGLGLASRAIAAAEKHRPPTEADRPIVQEILETEDALDLAPPGDVTYALDEPNPADHAVVAETPRYRREEVNPAHDPLIDEYFGFDTLPAAKPEGPPV